MTVVVHNSGSVPATVSLVPQPVSAFGEAPPKDPRDLARRSSEGIPGTQTAQRGTRDAATRLCSTVCV